MDLGVVHKTLRPQEIVIKYFLDFLARAYSRNVEGQDLLLKEYPNDLGGGQHRAAESPAEPSPQSQDLGTRGSPSLNQSQELKVSMIYVTPLFQCLLPF